MKTLVTPLKSSIDKIPVTDYNRIHALYLNVKDKITLNGKDRTIISRLSSKFPIVSIAGSGVEVEYSSKAIERILNGSCAFKS